MKRKTTIDRQAIIVVALRFCLETSHSASLLFVFRLPSFEMSWVGHVLG